MHFPTNSDSLLRHIRECYANLRGLEYIHETLKVMTLGIHKKIQYLKVLSAEKDDGVFVRKQTASVRLDIHHRFQELGRMTAILQREVEMQISNYGNDPTKKMFYEKFGKKASMYMRHMRKLRERLKSLGLPLDAQE